MKNDQYKMEVARGIRLATEKFFKEVTVEEFKQTTLFISKAHEYERSQKHAKDAA